MALRHFGRSTFQLGVFVGAFAIAGTLWTSPSQGQQLDEALAIAYQTNPSLLAARSLLRITNEEAPQARGGWRPNVSATLSAGGTYVNAESQDVTTTNRGSIPRTARLNINQPLYTGGAVDAAVASAEANIQAERARLFQTEQGVMLQAITAYVNVIRDQSTLELQVNNYKRLEKQLQAARDRFRVGEVTKTDVAQSESRVARAAADRTQAEGNLMTSRVEFERVVGIMPGTLVKPNLPSGLPKSREEAVDIALRENFALVRARFQEQSAVNRVAETEASLSPTAALVAQAQQSYDTSGSDNATTTLTAEIQVSIPIYQRGVVFSQIRAAKDSVQRNRLLVDEARRTTVDATASAYEAFNTALARIESLKKEVDSARIALDGVEQEATVGARTVLDVLDAEQELLNAQVSLVSAERNATVAAYDYLQSLGRLTAQDLGLPVEIYDYDRHFLAVEKKYSGTEPPK